MRKIKSIFAMIMATTLAFSMSTASFAASTGSGSLTDSVIKKESIEKAFDGSFFSATGFAKAGVNDRSSYTEDDDEYAVVTNETEFFNALSLAKAGLVKVIELRADMNLGWWELSKEAKEAGSGIINAYSGIDNLAHTPLSNPTLIETGLSDLKLSEINGLTIFSQTGNTIRHAQFQLQDSVNDFVMRNISINEVWEWDDFTGTGFGSTGGKGVHKRVGWTPMKINGAKNVWLDHCSFGLGFDGCVDLENGAEGISITWCKIGDNDYSVGSMLYKTTMYMEQLYQESIEKNNPKMAFTAYRIMRENGMTPEQIMEYMAYHSKVHLCGAGDKDTWLIPLKDADGNEQYDYSDGMTYTQSLVDSIKENGTSTLKEVVNSKDFKVDSAFGTMITTPDYSKTDANELIELSLGYNQYWNVGQRVPMIRGGVGHLFNCYINDSGTQKSEEYLSKKNADGKKISELIKAAGSSTGKLQRTMNARNGASIAADTCVWQNVNQPVPGAQYQKDDLINMNSPYHTYFGYSYTSIVNSKVQLNSSSDVYIGNSFDNGGKTDFFTAYTLKDNSVEFSWHNLAIKNAYRDKQITDEAVALSEYDKLTYSYQTMPLEDVEEVTEKYSGFNKVKMSAADWLKTSYSSDFKVETINENNSVDATSLTLDKDNATIYIDEGEHLQISAEIAPTNSKEKAEDIVWTSSDETVAKVNDCGLVTPLSYGDVTITAKLNDKLVATCNVKVAASPSKVVISNIPSKVYTGDIFELKASVMPESVENQTVVWNTNTSNIECLNADTGLFKAVKAATRATTVSAASKFTANRVGYQGKTGQSANIKIYDPEVPVTGIELSASALDTKMLVGTEVQITANAVPSNATSNKVLYSSSDDSVASVDENGKVTAISTGSAVITAMTVNNGFVATKEAVVVSSLDDDNNKPSDDNNKPSDDNNKPSDDNNKPSDDNNKPSDDNTLKVTKYGDADVNGKVDLNDAKLVLKLALGIKVTVSEQGKLNADFDANGKVDLTDAKYTLKDAIGIKVNITRK